MTDNQKTFTSLITIVGMIAFIISGVYFLLAGANTKDAEHISKENQTVKDCVDRQNTLEWCLQMFNK